MRTVVLGGTGCFGRRVLQELVTDPRYEVIAAGRRPRAGLPCDFARLDLMADDLRARLRALAPDVVVDCAGPYRPGRYAVVAAALDAGSDYLDLADNRAFVVGIARFDRAAQRARRVVRSGVSSVPALSSAVVAAHLGAFRRVEAIDLGISAPEHPPGVAAVASVLEQCGQPIGPAGSGHRTCRRDAPFAWMDAFRVHFPEPVGTRVVARCDVPDLALLPQRLLALTRVTFRGGVAAPWLMAGVRVFARLRRRGWFRNPGAWAGAMIRAANLLQPFSRGASGMYVRLFGTGTDGAPLAICWRLIAESHRGYRVPARGVVALANRLVRGEVEPGARACVMELTVDEYLGPDLPVTTGTTRLTGEAALRDEAGWNEPAW